MISTLLWEGTDLSTIDGLIASDLSGMWAPMTRRGNYELIPNRDGQRGYKLPFDSYQFTVSCVLSGKDEVELNARLLGLGTLFGTADGLGTLTRRLAASAGSHVDYTAQGAFGGFSGIQFTGLDPVEYEMTFDLLLTNLDGGWKRASDNAWVRP